MRFSTTSRAPQLAIRPHLTSGPADREGSCTAHGRRCKVAHDVGPRPSNLEPAVPLPDLAPRGPNLAMSCRRTTTTRRATTPRLPQDHVATPLTALTMSAARWRAPAPSRAPVAGAAVAPASPSPPLPPPPRSPHHRHPRHQPRRLRRRRQQQEEEDEEEDEGQWNSELLRSQGHRRSRAMATELLLRAPPAPAPPAGSSGRLHDHGVLRRLRLSDLRLMVEGSHEQWNGPASAPIPTLGRLVSDNTTVKRTVYHQACVRQFVPLCHHVGWRYHAIRPNPRNPTHAFGERHHGGPPENLTDADASYPHRETNFGTIQEHRGHVLDRLPLEQQ